MIFSFDKIKWKQYWQLVATLAIKKNIFFNASAITFNLFICSIPFILILISILGYILSIDAAFEELMRYGRELLPGLRFETQSGDLIQGAVTLERLLQPLVGARQVFGLIGLIVLIFFAQGLLYTLKQVLFNIFDIEDRRHPAMELVYNFFAFGVIGGVFVFFSMAIFMISLFSFDEYTIPNTEIVIRFVWMSDWLTGIVPVLFTFLLFYVIYRYISERRIVRRVALLAAILYTCLFEAARFGASLYLEYALTTYQYLYQGYTVLILIGFWGFYAAVLFIITSILARAWQDVYLEEVPAIEKQPYTAIS